MALKLIRQATGLGCRALVNKRMQRCYSLFQPDYLEVGKSKIPVYPTLNIQITGYRYPVLESYQSFIYKLAEIFEVDVDNGWAFPPKVLKVHKYKKGGTVVESEYVLKIYERNIQISELTATSCPVFIRTLEATLPEGVSLKVNEYTPDLEKERYIPDKQLLDLKTELEDLNTK